MAFNPTGASAKILVAVHLVLYDSDEDADLNLYLSNGTFVASDVTWHGRLQGSRYNGRAPKLYQRGWAHPTFTASVITDGDSGGSSFWDTYMDPSIIWRDAAATVYVIDFGAGESKTEMIGTVRLGPTALKKGEPFKLQIDGYYPDVFLPAPRMSIPNKYYTGLIQPARQGVDTINGALNATQTTVQLATVPPSGQWIANRVAIVDSEAMFIVSVTAGGVVTVVRGYAETTAATHVNGSTIGVFRNGPQSGLMPSGSADWQIPFVFGDTGSHRGIVVQTFPMAFENVGATGNFECWFSRGAGPEAQQAYVMKSGAINTDAAPDTWNDYDDQNTGGSTHLDPNPLLTGSYVVEGIIPWAANEDKIWVRCHGITDNGLVGGNPHRYPGGIANYLASNTRWACGLTSPFYGNTITAWNTGDWQDEYTETYAEHIEMVVPAAGTSEAVKLMDALQDLAMLIGSDVFTKEGKLYPKRRTVESTADWTVYEWQPVEPPEELLDPNDDYCNVLTLGHNQDVLSQPAGNNAPTGVPYTVTVQDDDEIEARGYRVEANMSSKWSRFRLSATWTQSDTGDQTDHLDYLTAAAEDHLAMRAQQQVWVKATLPHTFMAAEQGETIAYSIDGYTTTKGQIRDIVRNYDLGRVEITSWHGAPSA